MTVYNNMFGKKFNGGLALIEHLLSGGKVTQLSAILVFGVQNVRQNIANLRRKGYEIVSRKLPFDEAIQDINSSCLVQAAEGLPIEELFITEYRIKNLSKGAPNISSSSYEKRV